MNRNEWKFSLKRISHQPADSYHNDGNGIQIYPPTADRSSWVTTSPKPPPLPSRECRLPHMFAHSLCHHQRGKDIPPIRAPAIAAEISLVIYRRMAAGSENSLAAMVRARDLTRRVHAPGQ